MGGGWGRALEGRRGWLVLAGLLVACATPKGGAGPSVDVPEEGIVGAKESVPSVVDRGDGFFSAVAPTMGTEVEFLLGGGSKEVAARAVKEALAELARLEAMMSEWRPDSPISAVNAAAGREPVVVPRELYDLVAQSLEAARLSDGAFDPTWAGMRGLWRFGDAMDGTIPTPAEIEAARRRVDWRKVTLDPTGPSIFLQKEGMALGLGGIAKGYAVDRLAEGFRSLGIDDFLIHLGGDLYTSGRRGERPWFAGIQDPRAPGEIFATIELGDGAFSTSGDYERYFEAGGRRYHHIIDPSTGWPAMASRSVTALCPDALLAETVTKPVFIFGPEKGIPWAKERGCEVVVVDEDNVVHVSDGLEGRLEWRQPTP